MKIKTRWALYGPKGKRAGLKNQHQVALQLLAIYLSSAGRSSGIIDALIPRTEKQLNYLEKLTDRRYTIKKVAARRHLTVDVRQAVMSDTLMAKLAIEFEKEMSASKRAMHAVNREFAVWICRKLNDSNPNIVKELVGKANQELLNRTKPDWWKKQINNRVRNLKK